jgi:hypothetical protein
VDYMGAEAVEPATDSTMWMCRTSLRGSYSGPFGCSAAGAS